MRKSDIFPVALHTLVGAVTLLWLLWSFIPAGNVMKGLGTLLISGLACWYISQRCRPLDSESDATVATVDLPLLDNQGPAVLVCGDRLEMLFQGHPLRKTAQGWWLRVGDVAHLTDFVRSLQVQFPRQVGQLSIMYVCHPDQHQDEAILRSTLKILRQRCAWILGTYIETSAGNKAGDLLEAMKVAAPAKTLSNPRGCNIPVRYAALTEYHTDITHALNAAISKLTTRIEGIVQPLPPALPCWLMLECDNDVYPLVEQQLKAELLQKTGRIFHLMTGKGLGALDAWLDTRWDNPGLLVAITLSLPASPSEDDADAVSMVVFSNRKAHAWPDALRLYRPERGSEATLTKTLERALLWAKIGADTLRGSWISGPCLIAGSAWNNACEENDVKFSLVEDNFSIDPVLGYAGHAAPWVAITLANAAFEQRGTQVIAAQPNADKKDIWVSVITNEEDCKGMSRNV